MKETRIQKIFFFFFWWGFCVSSLLWDIIIFNYLTPLNSFSIGLQNPLFSCCIPSSFSVLLMSHIYFKWQYVKWRFLKYCMQPFLLNGCHNMFCRLNKKGGGGTKSRLQNGNKGEGKKNEMTFKMSLKLDSDLLRWAFAAGCLKISLFGFFVKPQSMANKKTVNSKQKLLLQDCSLLNTWSLALYVYILF